MIIGSLVQLPSPLAYVAILLKPLPAPVIIAWHFILKLLLILGIISGIGILCFKDIFRRIAVFLSILNISSYIIETPLALKNMPNFVDQQVMKVMAINPIIPQHVHYSMLWFLLYQVGLLILALQFV